MNRSFADQLADSMSADPVRRSASGSSMSGNTMADSISQSFANSLTGNDAGSDRVFFGEGSFAEQTTQDLMDDAFGFEDERRKR